MFHFASPWYLLLLPLPLLVRYLLPKSRGGGESPFATIRFPGLERAASAYPLAAFDGNKASALFFALTAAFFLLVLALMQPEIVDQYTNIKSVGHDIALAVDISPSMQALDFSTMAERKSRLDVTKEVVGKFVRGREGDRVALITFGEHAYLQVPLTLDTLSVSSLLNDTLPGMAGQATAIGDAIGLAVRNLRERPEGSRVLILLTDGEDNASSIPPIEAAKLAQKYGIKIYAIGVGSSGMVPYPTPLGGYQMVQMAIDEEALKEIARATGGVYFHAGDKGSLERIYEEIDAMEKTEANSENYLIREPLYQYPLAAALALLTLTAAAPLYRRILYAF